MTPEEKAICRIAEFLCCSPTDVLALPATDFDLLVRFYQEEPWGSWRDNIHAAMIAREVRQGRVKRGRAVSLEDFMVIPPEVRRQKNLAGFVESLKAMAGGKRVHASQYKPPKRGKRGSGKTGSSPRGAIRTVLHRAPKG